MRPQDVFRCELRPNGVMIVDLAVEYDMHGSVFVCDRLPPATSMMLSLRMPSATPGATKCPSSSGPR
jgi:hypothetical protein